MVCAHGRHDCRCHGAGAGRVALRAPAGLRLRAERRLPPGARAARADDGRSPIHRLGAPDRRRVHRRSAAWQSRRCQAWNGTSRSTPATAVFVSAITATSSSSGSCCSTRTSGAGRRRVRRSGSRSSRACWIAFSSRRTPTACSTTRSTRRRCSRLTRDCRTTGATCMAPSTRSINARRDALSRRGRCVLRNLPKYRRHVWEPRADPALPLGSFDGYADAIESAIYLVAREPVPEALDWIESETQVMLGMQRPRRPRGVLVRRGQLQSHRDALRVDAEPGCASGALAARASDRRRPGRRSPAPQSRVAVARAIRFDYARHRRVLNFDRNYVRLNEFPEWFVVDENRLYRLRGQADSPR